MQKVAACPMVADHHHHHHHSDAAAAAAVMEEAGRKVEREDQQRGRGSGRVAAVVGASGGGAGEIEIEMAAAATAGGAAGASSSGQQHDDDAEGSLLRQKSTWKRFLAHAGPGFLISLAYLDPSNGNIYVSYIRNTQEYIWHYSEVNFCKYLIFPEMHFIWMIHAYSRILLPFHLFLTMPHEYLHLCSTYFG